MAMTDYHPTTNEMRFSGSNGNTLRRKAKYPYNWDEAQGYRFVGDSADSLAWKNEYKRLYKK